MIRYSDRDIKFNLDSVLSDLKRNKNAKYVADLSSANTYYPFGMLMPVRNWSSEWYRYGFGGHEKDDELAGEGNHLSFGDYGYNPRLGRRFNVDPFAHAFPSLSPYSYGSNNPIYFVDSNGEIIKVHYLENGISKYYTLKPSVKPQTDNKFVNQVYEAVSHVMKNDGNKTFQKLSASHRTVTINEIDIANDRTSGNIDKSLTKINDIYIHWNPTAAIINVKTGGGLSPSTLLLHETAHAERMISIDSREDLQDYINDRSIKVKDYTNMEEKRVIDNIEAPYLYRLGYLNTYNNELSPKIESPRIDHQGNYYKVDNVNSITPANGSTVYGQSQKTDRQKMNLIEMETQVKDNTSVSVPKTTPENKND